jgi:hypothetical protein
MVYVKGGALCIKYIAQFHSKDNEMIPKIISFLLYLGAFLIDLTIQKIPEQTKMFIIISARKVRVAYL